MSKLVLRYKDYGTSEIGYPYSEDEIWWEKDCPDQVSLESAKKELYGYIRKTLSIDWFSDSITEKSEKVYTLNHLICEVMFMGNIIDSWELKNDDFIFNRELVEIL